eukprot:Gb_21762 [translate_table: standard]
MQRCESPVTGKMNEDDVAATKDGIRLGSQLAQLLHMQVYPAPSSQKNCLHQ